MARKSQRLQTKFADDSEDDLVPRVGIRNDPNPSGEHGEESVRLASPREDDLPLVEALARTERDQIIELPIREPREDRAVPEDGLDGRRRGCDVPPPRNRP